MAQPKTTYGKKDARTVALPFSLLYRTLEDSLLMSITKVTAVEMLGAPTTVRYLV